MLKYHIIKLPEYMITAVPTKYMLYVKKMKKQKVIYHYLAPPISPLDTSAFPHIDMISLLLSY